MDIVMHATRIVNSATAIDSWGMNDLGKLVREARERQNMRSYELADAIGKQRSFVSRLESGELKETPSPEDLRAIGRTLGIPMRSLLVSLGYLDPDEPEPGVAYVIREDDPRAAMLATLEGVAPALVASCTGMVALMLKAIRREQGEESVTGESGAA